jgi:hypothetical protein
MEKGLKKGTLALFKGENGKWFEGELYEHVVSANKSVETYICKMKDGALRIATESKPIPVKEELNSYHISFFTDSSEFYSNGLIVKGENMASALLIFNEKHPNIDPIYIIKQN